MAKQPSLSKIMGPTNSYNGVPIQTVTPPTYANPVPQNGNYQQFLASLQQAQAAANKQNQTDFGQALGLESQGFEQQQQSIQQAIAAQAGYGQAEQTQLQQQLQQNLGSNLSSNVSRGLANSTAAGTSQAPIYNAYNQGVAGISNQAANLQAGLYSNLASSQSQGANSIANLLAQENNQGPNQALLAQLQQAASAGAVPSTVTNFSGAQPPINSAGGGGQAPAGNSGIKPPSIPPVPMIGPGAAANPAQGLYYPSNNGSQELPPSQFNSDISNTMLPSKQAPNAPPPTPDVPMFPESAYGAVAAAGNAALGSIVPQVGPGGGSAPDATLSGGATPSGGYTPSTTPASAPPPGVAQSIPPAQQSAAPAPAPINIAPGGSSPAPAPSPPPSISNAVWAQAPGGQPYTQQQWQGLTPSQQKMIASGTPL